MMETYKKTVRNIYLGCFIASVITFLLCYTFQIVEGTEYIPVTVCVVFAALGLALFLKDRVDTKFIQDTIIELGISDSFLRSLIKDASRTSQYSHLYGKKNVPTFEDISSSVTKPPIEKRVIVLTLLQELKFNYQPLKLDEKSISFMNEYPELLMVIERKK